MEPLNVNYESKRTRKRIHELMSTQSNPDPVIALEQHDRLIALLKKQYGYSNNKAVGEMEKLLKQFRITKKSLTFHRFRPIDKHTHVD